MKSKKKLLSLLVLVVMAAVLLSMTTFAKPKLNKKNATIQVGQSVTLMVKGANGQKVKWSSSNNAVAAVSKKKSNKAVVTGKSAGTVTIMAKVGKKKTLKCTVVVVDSSKNESGSSNNNGSSDTGSANSGSSNNGTSNSDTSDTSEKDTGITIETPILPQTYSGLRIDKIDISESLRENDPSLMPCYDVIMTFYVTVVSESNHFEVSLYRLSDGTYMGSRGEGPEGDVQVGDSVKISFHKPWILPSGSYRLEFGRVQI